MRTTWVLAAAAVLVAVTVTGSVVFLSSAKHATPAAQEPPANTATVAKGTLSAMVALGGTLTYGARSDGSLYAVINQARGIYTKLPAVGQVISQGQVLYRVDDSPVVLLYGSTPAYRTLAAGATGADVAELNADLVALGDATSAQLSPTSASFEPATTTALEKLQAALGVPQDGTLTLGQAVFEPTAVRVTTVSAQLGGSTVSGQAVIQGTSTARRVTIHLDASQQTDVAAGDKVTIALPNNQSTPGVVSSVGTVATCPPSSGPGGSSAGPTAPGNDNCSSGGSGSNATPTITVDVTPSDPSATGTWDQAPVQVEITTKVVESALSVPVTALVGKSGGGFAVEVVRAGGRRELVAVKLGLFDTAGGRVEVEGDLHEGDQVVVPSL
jgi:hypothetical protein